MRFGELSAKQLEKSKECKTKEERLAFLMDNGVELSDEQLESIVGGKHRGGNHEDKCPVNHSGYHKWKETGVTRPGEWFGDRWPDVQVKCEHCGQIEWSW